MLIVACFMIIKGQEIFMTGNVVKTTPTAYIISNTDGTYEFPKEDCIIKTYKATRK